MYLFSVWRYIHTDSSVTFKMGGVGLGGKSSLLALICGSVLLNVTILHANECNLSMERQGAITLFC